MPCFLLFIARETAEKTEIKVALERCRSKVPEGNPDLLLQVAKPSGGWVQEDRLYCYFSLARQCCYEEKVIRRQSSDCFLYRLMLIRGQRLLVELPQPVLR